MNKLIIVAFLFLPVSSWSQQKNLTKEEQQIIEMEKKLEARKEALKRKKLQESDKQKELAEIRKKKKELELEERAILSNSKKNKEAKSAKAELRGRDYYVDTSSLLFLMFKDVVDRDSGSDSEYTNQSLKLDGGWNFGHFEVGPMVSQRDADFDSFKTRTLALSVKGTYNFIENAPGNNHIPFVELTLSKVEFKRTGVGSFEDNYTSMSLGGGLNYFPFGEILSIKPRVYYLKTDGEDYVRSGFRFTNDVVVYF